MNAAGADRKAELHEMKIGKGGEREKDALSGVNSPLSNIRPL